MINVVTELHKLGISDTYVVLPIEAITKEQLYQYWRALELADTIKYRWSDISSPTAKQVTEYCIANPTHKYIVVDVDTGTTKADFSLGPFTGKAAQVHFSMCPTNTTNLNIFLADEITNCILYQWKDVNDLEEVFLDTIFGLTPVSNRPACLFIRKAGFKAIGTLISGTKYLNEVDDALLTMKTRKV